MAKFNVIGYDNQIIGEVDAADAVDAWSKAGKKFSNVLDVRQISERGIVGWDEKDFIWYHPVTMKRLSVGGRMWGNEYDDMVTIIKLVPEMLDNLRSELEPREYSGIIESGNIVTMVGDADGYHYIKTFPSLAAAWTEAERLMGQFSTYDNMEEAGYFDRNKYLGLARGGA